MELFFEDGFVGEHTLEFSPDGPFEISLKGEIACRGNIVIVVNKTLEVLGGSGGNALVGTTVYSYNVLVRGFGNVFRYDNCHTRQGHPDDHHKHEFDWRVNQLGEGNVIWVGADNWPTLGEVIEEAKNWYLENNYCLLPVYPNLGLR